MSTAERRSGDGDAIAPDLAERKLSQAPRRVQRRLRPRLGRGGTRLVLMLGGVLLVAAGAGYAWLTGGRYVSTDDAYVGAAKLMVSTDVSGLILSVDVHEGQPVKAGDLLFRIDPEQFQIAVDNATAKLKETALSIQAMKLDYGRMLNEIEAERAQVALDQAEFDRYAELVKNKNASQSAYDEAHYSLLADQRKLDALVQTAQMQLAKLGGDPDIAVDRHPLYLQDQAALAEAKRQLTHATVRAPFDGVVTEVDSLQPGLYLVSQMAALTNMGAVALVSTGDVWVDAQMKETDMTNVKPDDPVEVTVDTYPGKVWQGRVESISPASGSQFSVLPAQNSSGNWVKVVQRIPVRVVVEQAPDDPVLRAGMSVTVEIDTGKDRSLSDLF